MVIHRENSAALRDGPFFIRISKFEQRSNSDGWVRRKGLFELKGEINPYNQKALFCGKNQERKKSTFVDRTLSVNT